MTQPMFDFDPVDSGGGASSLTPPSSLAPDVIEGCDIAQASDTMSIGEAIRAVNDALHAGLGGLVWVRGEIHNAKASRGHRYFDLVDDAEGSADVRQRPKVSAALFAQAYQRVRPRLERAGVRLAEGLCVRMRGSFEVHGQSGRLSFRVVDVDPEFTLGKLAVQRDAMLQRLAGEGLLDANAALPMPLVPLRVGVVTSPDSEGWRDFRTNLDESGIGFRLHLAGAVVQGANAPIQVSRALRRLSERRDLDVIAVVRGGGSKSDLATFDHEYVARAIAASAVPVLTGVGHDNDRSIADEVAHTACKTPTACAQVLIDRVRDFERQLDRRSAALGRVASRLLTGSGHGVDNRGKRVKQLAGAAVSDSRRRLAGTSRELAASSRRTLEAADAHLANRHERAWRGVERTLREESRRLDANAAAMWRVVPTALARAANHVDLLAARVAAVDPLLALQRGWSITTTAHGHLVRGVADVAAGDTVVTRVRDGRLTSTVSGVEADEEGGIDD